MNPPARSTICFAIRGPIDRADLPGLCMRVRALLDAEPAGTAYCDVEGVRPDAETVDALARLALAAGRRGCRIRLRRADPGLLALVEFIGLDDVLLA